MNICGSGLRWDSHYSSMFPSISGCAATLFSAECLGGNYAFSMRTGQIVMCVQGVDRLLSWLRESTLCLIH